jgi:hypothetical protein
MRAPNFRIAVLGGYLSIIGIAVFSGQARAGAIQTKAFLLEHCPSVQPPQNQERGKFAFGATLTGIFAPRLVDGIVDLVDKALKSAAEARTYPFDAPPVIFMRYRIWARSTLTRSTNVLSWCVVISLAKKLMQRFYRRNLGSNRFRQTIVLQKIAH